MELMNRNKVGGLFGLLANLAVLGLLMPLHSNANEIVQIETDRGVIKLELFSDDAPLTVENFLGYVDNGHYNGTFFHRSVPGFVLQGGGFAFTPDQGDFFSSGTSRIFQGNPVMNEPGISNLRGTVAMAKLGGDPDSATNQWFFNLADNSANLDSQNGGFTVFGQVIEDGMTVVDAIAAFDRCESIPYDNCFNATLPLDLGPTPFVDVVANQIIQPENLARINRIILGSDSDGISDSEEDGHPDGGDGNSDGTPDARQDHVASFADANNNYITMAVDPGMALESVKSVDSTFVFFSSPPASLAGLNFSHGFFSFNISGANAGGAVSMSMTLPAGEAPVSYYKFGPTPDNTAPHWYEFLYDGETGAEISGNVINLHFVDGKRGDSDLDATNGVIADPGGPAVAAPVTGVADSGGGCSLSGRDTRPGQAGAWWLLLAGLVLLSHGLPRRCVSRMVVGRKVVLKARSWRATANVTAP